MKHLTIIAICLSVLLNACHEITDIDSRQPTFDCTIRSRLTEHVSLPDNSTALFNISGAIQITDQLFTYTNHTWKSEEPFEWEGQEGYIHLTAIYPAMEEYTVQTMYTANKLTDVLIAQDTLQTNQDIEIRFSHLFSSLTIHANDVIQKELQEIRLTVPQSVSSLNASTGEYTTTDEIRTVSEAVNDTGIYPFILPPMEEAELILQLTMQDGTSYTHYMPTHTFRSGYRYTCNIVKEDQRPGIRTVDDLITFSLLINKQSYTGEKELADFGEEVDGKMVYRLLNDLTFTEEESQRLLPIGYYDARAFQHVFDGEGHCISNLTLPDKSTYSKVNATYSGLFGHIGQDGTVRNLHISHAKSVSKPSCTRIGVIAALNDGKILDCSVNHSSIALNENEKFGFITGQLSSTGYIVNSCTTNNTLTATLSKYIGGICGYANGTILNCYAANNEYSLHSYYSGIGSIAGYSASNYLFNMMNCYTYYRGENSHHWALMEKANNVKVQNFFYNGESLYNKSASSAVKLENVWQYDEDFKAEGRLVVDFLNDWVSNDENSNLFQGFIFKEWTFSKEGITFKDTY